MNKPTKSDLYNLLRKIQSKLNEHQKEDYIVRKGYTLASNIKMTEISKEITSILIKTL